MGEVLRVDQTAPSEDALARAEAVLVGGGVIVVPTDSVYGIGCAATPGNPARERVFCIKRRPHDMTLPWLVADAGDLGRFGSDVPAWAHALAQAFWPGALTLVVRASQAVPDEYRRHPDETIALREPDSELVRALARRVGPLAVTSANTHGAPSATSGASVEEHIVSEANLILDAGPAPLAIASTIVDCTGEAPRILREGAISHTAILRAARM